MPFLGNTPAESYISFAKQDITGNGGTSYSLNHPVTNAADIELFVNNVQQEPTEAYTASGSTLTLSEAIASTDDCYCIFRGRSLQTVSPADGSVSTAKIIDGNVTAAKLAASLDLSTKSLTMPTGSLLQFVHDQSAIGGSSDTIPQDSTPPLITEGVEIFSCAVTPKASNSNLLIQMNCQMSGSGNGHYVVWSLFEGNTCVGAWSNYLTASNGGVIASFNIVRAASTTNARTYSVRAGFASGTAGTLYYGYVSGNSYGQLNQNYMTIQEIAG